MKYLKKAVNVLFWILDKINKKAYKKVYPLYLRWLGIVIDRESGSETWISPTCFFDSAAYNRIRIGRDVTISFGVTVLAHDYSIVHTGKAIGKRVRKIVVDDVYIGNNVFIGAKSIILPGTIIGDNCIIGAGSVVKGRILENSVYAGNPAKRICSINEYAEKHMELFIQYDEL